MKTARLKIDRRRLLATLSGLSLLLALLALVFLDGVDVPELPERLAVREVRLYQEPPPPPPPVNNRDEARDAGPPMSLSPIETLIPLETLDLDVELTAGSFGDFGFGTGGLGDGFGAGLGTVGLGELDSMPVVRSAPIYPYPIELSEAGIHRFLVDLHILVDEEGVPHLLGIVESPYPSQNQSVAEFVDGVRFTPPTKLGIPVRTEYLWPVLFRHEPSE
jgi:hypothetical protein